MSIDKGIRSSDKMRVGLLFEQFRGEAVISLYPNGVNQIEVSPYLVDGVVDGCWTTYYHFASEVEETSCSAMLNDGYSLLLKPFGRILMVIEIFPLTLYLCDGIYRERIRVFSNPFPEKLNHPEIFNMWQIKESFLQQLIIASSYVDVEGVNVAEFGYRGDLISLSCIRFGKKRFYVNETLSGDRIIPILFVSLRGKRWRNPFNLRNEWHRELLHYVYRRCYRPSLEN